MKTLLKAIAFLVLAVAISGQAQAQQVGNSQPIIYRVFDSLEQHLCERMKLLLLDDYDSVYAVIGPAMNEPKPNSVYRYEVTLVGYKHKKNGLSDDMRIVNQIVQRSNRYLRVCDWLCPVYFRWIDQLFVLEPPNKILNDETGGISVSPMDGVGPGDIDFYHKKIIR